MAASETITKWLQRQTERQGSKNIILNLFVRRILLVSGVELSRHILADPPTSCAYAAGTLKKKAMDFLAPNALTTSQDDQWRVLRAYNEKVLQAGSHHVYQGAFLNHVHEAFAQPIRNMPDVRQRMGQVMLAAVFGEDNAPNHLIQDVQRLFAQVGLRTALLGSKLVDERDQFQKTLEQLWRNKASKRNHSLLGLAHEAVPEMDERYRSEEFLVHQIPNWMFTFTGSGSDLLARSLAMILARPEIMKVVQLEISKQGSPTRAQTINRLDFIEACIMETGRLYPPVSKTLHKACQRDEFGSVEIVAGTEILHLFALTNRDIELDTRANNFLPERWMDEHDSVHQLYPNLFLSGARACPGRNLILFIAKAAIAYLLSNQFHQAKKNNLTDDPVPFTFPEEVLQF